MSAETAVIAAVQAILLLDAEMSTLVGEKVFDAVPGDDQPGEPPLIYGGPFNRRRFSDEGWTVTGRFFVQSTGFDRTEAWEIADAAIRALDMAEITLTGAYEAADVLRVSQAGDVLNREGGFHAVFFDVSTVVQRAD